MEYCPNCSTFMRWYMKYSCGVPIMGYHCDTCGYDTNNHVVINASSTGPLPYPFISAVSEDIRKEVDQSNAQKLSEHISQRVQEITHVPIELGYDVIITTRRKQNRKHKRPRINKKWAKRFGFTELEIQDDHPIISGGLVFMTKSCYDKLLREIGIV